MKWNHVVKSETTGCLSPVGHEEIKLTLACGAAGTGWTKVEAFQIAEMAWHMESQSNPFVIRNGAPVHIENAGDLTRDEILERVPDATI